MASLKYIKKLISWIIFLLVNTCSNYGTISKKRFIWYISFITLYLIVFILAIIYSDPEDYLGPEGYGFASRIRYILHLFGISFIMVFTNIRVLLNRNLTNSTFLKFRRHRDRFKELRKFIPVKIKGSWRRLLLNCFIFILGFAVMIWDIMTAFKPLSFFLWISLYLPGFSILLYWLTFSAYFQICLNDFLAINEVLEKYAKKELSAQEVFEVSKNRLRPSELVRTLPGSKLTPLDELIIIHGEVCTSIHDLNSACSFELFLTCLAMAVGGVLVAFHFALDLIELSKGGSISIANSRACDYWPFLLGFFMNISMMVTINLEREFESTAPLLIRLNNLYPDLKADIEMYLLQISHENAKISAGGFFYFNEEGFNQAINSALVNLINLLQLRI